MYYYLHPFDHDRGIIRCQQKRNKPEAPGHATHQRVREPPATSLSSSCHHLSSLNTSPQSCTAPDDPLLLGIPAHPLQRKDHDASNVHE